jgi:hypothetical protein
MPVKTDKLCDRCGNILMGLEQRGTTCNDCLGTTDLTAVETDYTDPEDRVPTVTEMEDAAAAVLPTLQGKHYLAVAPFAAQDDSRPVLGGIMVEPECIAAADGFRLAVVRGSSQIETDESLTGEWRKPRRFILGTRYFKAWKQIVAKADRIRFSRSGDGKANMEAVTEDGLLTPSVVGLPDLYATEGIFPDFEQIIPKLEGTRVILNAKYLRDACDLAIALHGKGGKGENEPQIILSTPVARRDGGEYSDKGYRIDIAARAESPEATVVIMPMSIGK